MEKESTTLPHFKLDLGMSEHHLLEDGKNNMHGIGKKRVIPLDLPDTQRKSFKGYRKYKK